MATYDVTPLDTALEFDIGNASCKSIVRIPNQDRVLVAWFRDTSQVMVQAFNVNTSTGAVTAIGSPVDVEASSGGPLDTGICIEVIDENNAVVAWPGSGADGFIRLVSIDSSGNVTTNGSALEYDTAQGYTPNITKWTSDRILVVWDGSAFDGFAQIMQVNTSAGTITKIGTAHEFDTSTCYNPRVVRLNDDKALVSYQFNSNTGKCLVLNVNPSTYAVTTAGSATTFEASTMGGINSCFMEDNGSTIKIVNLAGVSTTLRAYSLSVDTSTWGITVQNTSNIGTAASLTGYEYAITKVDAETLLCFYRGQDSDGFNQTFSYTTSGGVGTTIDVNEFLITDIGFISDRIVQITDDIFVVAWADAANDGFIQSFRVELPTSGGIILPNFLGFAGL